MKTIIKKWTIPLIVVMVAGISVFLYLKSQPASTGKHDKNATAQNVLRFKAVREDLLNTVEVKGKSSYQKVTWLNAPFGGDVKKWNVADGSQVSKGDVLFQLDDAALRKEIAGLQADSRKLALDADIARFQQDTGAAQAGAATELAANEKDAKQRYADSQTRAMQEELSRVQLDTNKYQLEQKVAKLNQSGFPAPESGIFLFEGAKEPSSVKENERIGKIVDLSKLELICNVGEYDIFKLKAGMPVEVTVDALKDAKLKGKVEKLSKFAKTTTESTSAAITEAAQFEVVVSLEPDERLIAGLSLTGTIETDRKVSALVIPTIAVQQDKEGYYVLVEGANGPDRKPVKLGLETADKTEIADGLQEGDTVVIP